MTDLHNFNAGRKSWKMYAKELTSINGDDLTLNPYSGKMMNIKSGKTSFKNTSNVQKMLVDTTNEIILDCSGDGRFGNAQLGTWNDPNIGDSHAVFGAKDQIVTNTNYALLQDNNNGNTYLNAPSNAAIHFRNNNSADNMIINANGVGIGATPNANYKLLVNGDISCNKIYVDEIHTDKIISRINSSAKIETFNYFGTIIWTAYASSNVGGWLEAWTGSTTVTPSDDNLKHNETIIPNSIDIIKLLKPRKYIQSTSIDYDASHNDSKERFGFIAQDVEAIDELVNVVEEIPDKNYATNNTMIKALDYNSLFTISVKALKEVINKVEDQKNTIESQNTKINNLENENILIKTKLNEILTELGKSTI